MHWVIITGASVDEARTRALDVLGIDEADLDYEVLTEPTSRLFGLRTTPARVRARVRPRRPRPKLARRPRRTKGGGRSGGGRSNRSNRGSSGSGRSRHQQRTQDGASSGRSRRGKATADRSAETEAPRADGSRRRQRGSDLEARAERRAALRSGPGGPAPIAPVTEAEPVPAPAESGAGPASDPDATPENATPENAEATVSGTNAAPEGAAEVAPTAASAPDSKDSHPQPRSGETKGTPMSDIALSEQEPTAVAFVSGLLDAFGIEAAVDSTTIEDDDAVEIAVTGEDLGLLVGPRGSTLSAVSELTRTAVAQQHSGRLEGRLRVDIAGYRARRKEALVRFAGQMADKARESGAAVALEPMSPPDRKIVHDAVNELDGVYTESRGEDRRRHVVILPD